MARVPRRCRGAADTEGVMGAIYKRGQKWWIKYYRSGRPFYESS